ncbi:DMT family transporter [Brenneria corticis]|uniref:QacE family quaternary ammonium compound efflux SMR transporter n=1 Tax=Brenneria corticis TaxID=2173106 RepID=A0A2U1TR49_9GAMM|nr:multidrug efflux SMR transporter [Brenneria sp. CFCC 11842]PWC11883.1 QacE family quaternary ammonium compound efflux SMR transporter [Brenneria sp. CFCC 11842]
MTRRKCYFWLLVAIIFEIFATNMLILSDGITRVLPSLLATLGYMVSYYTLTLSLQRISLGFAYALWSGIGILATNILGAIFWDIPLQTISIIGMWLIIIGVLIINILAKNDAGVSQS